MLRVSILVIACLTVLGVALASGVAVAEEDSAETQDFHWVEIEDWHDLDEVRENPGQAYLLMNDLDADTPGYEEVASANANDGAGFEPIGTYEEVFSGDFEGQGYTISDVVIDRPDEGGVGLFGYSGMPDFGSGSGDIYNLTVADATITGGGDVGAVVGWFSAGDLHDTSARNVDVTGDGGVGGLVGYVRGGSAHLNRTNATGTVTTTDHEAGGLVGRHGAEIDQSYADVTVTVPDDGFGDRIGGLTGTNADVVKRSSAHGSVEASTDASNFVGGLVGYSQNGFLEDVRADTDVTGQTRVGGLVGVNEETGFDTGIVENATATGTVEGETNVGGLAGENLGTILNATATGDVTGEEQVGGLAGKNDRYEFAGDIAFATAEGTVEGDYRVGGLVGFNAGDIEYTMAWGDVIGGENVSALVGANGGEVRFGVRDEPPHGTVDQSYATGAVSGNGPLGGLAGSQSTANSALTNSYWDTETTGMDEAVGDFENGLAMTIEGLTTDEMQGETAVDTMVGFDFEHVWAVDEERYPYFQTPPQQPDIATGVLSGIVDEAFSDEVVPDANVIVTDDDGAVTGLTTTNQNGGYSMRVPTGTVTVIANAPGYEDGVVTDVTIEENWETEQNISLFPEERDGTLEGEVTDDDDTPLDDIEVNIDHEMATVEPTTTNEDGEYSVDLWEGEYTVSVDRLGFESYTAEVTITDGETTVHDIELSRLDSGTVNGSVRDADNQLLDGVDLTFSYDGDIIDTVTTADGLYSIDLAPATYSVTIDEAGFAPVSTTVTVEENEQTDRQFTLVGEVEPIGDDTAGPPQDMTGDGLLEDVNGDGVFNVIDVQYLFWFLYYDEIQDNHEVFDFAGMDNDRVSIFDVQALFHRLLQW